MIIILYGRLVVVLRSWPCFCVVSYGVGCGRYAACEATESGAEAAGYLECVSLVVKTMSWCRYRSDWY